MMKNLKNYTEISSLNEESSNKDAYTLEQIREGFDQIGSSDINDYITIDEDDLPLTMEYDEKYGEIKVSGVLSQDINEYNIEIDYVGITRGIISNIIKNDDETGPRFSESDIASSIYNVFVESISSYVELDTYTADIIYNIGGSAAEIIISASVEKNTIEISDFDFSSFVDDVISEIASKIAGKIDFSF